MKSEAQTVGIREFAERLGYGPRKFISAMRAGQIPMPLNPTVRTPLLRWGGQVVADYCAGIYKGPMLPADAVKPARTPSKPKQAAGSEAPAKATKSNKEKAAALNKAEDAPAAQDEEITHVIMMPVTVHRDGSFTVKPERFKN